MSFLNNREIGNRLKSKREELKLKSRQFAIGAGVDPSQYAKIEKGELPITTKIMDKLAVQYQLDSNSIIYGTNVPRGKKELESSEEIENHSSSRIDDILACNKALSDAALEQAKRDVIREEKERDMVKTNLELLRMIKTASHSSEDNLLANPDVQMKLLEALAALGTGARWNTKEEALIALGNMISVPGSEEKKNVSTHAGAGKKSTVRQ